MVMNADENFSTPALPSTPITITANDLDRLVLSNHYKDRAINENTRGNAFSSLLSYQVLYEHSQITTGRRNHTWWKDYTQERIYRETTRLAGMKWLRCCSECLHAAIGTMLTLPIRLIGLWGLSRKVMIVLPCRFREKLPTFEIRSNLLSVKTVDKKICVNMLLLSFDAVFWFCSLPKCYFAKFFWSAMIAVYVGGCLSVCANRVNYID